MTTLREALKQLLSRVRLERGPAPDPPRVDYAYTIYWTKMVRDWDADRRLAIDKALSETLAQPDFENNAYERRYFVPGLDEHKHSGASLLALRKVLAAFDSEASN